MASRKSLCNTSTSMMEGRPLLAEYLRGEGEIKKPTRYLMDTLPICEALSKQSGLPCKNFASKGKRVCRIHGGRSFGARTKEGKARQKKASWKHGFRSK